MNELLEGSLIAAERIGGIKVRQPLSADRTEVVFIQWIVICKGRPAGATEEFGLERFGKSKAGRANRNAGHIGERLLTQTAIVRKNQVEKARSKELQERQPTLWRQTVL